MQHSKRENPIGLLHTTWSRRSVLAGIATIPLLVAACGPKPSAPNSTATLDDFPQSLGRGFPPASTDGVNNRGTGINVGDLAPNFLLQTTDGATLALHDLAGRPRLINFWATWCGPCRIEMPEIVGAASTHDDLLVLAVNVQEELPTVEAFAKDFNMNILVPLDSEAKIRNAYAVRGMPTTVFVDRENRIHTVWMGVLTPAKLDDLLAQLI